MGERKRAFITCVSPTSAASPVSSEEKSARQRSRTKDGENARPERVCVCAWGGDGGVGGRGGACDVPTAPRTHARVGVTLHRAARAAKSSSAGVSSRARGVIVAPTWPSHACTDGGGGCHNAHTT
eukprot:6213658-Pleurochrysis_carterae.AAC.4